MASRTVLHIGTMKSGTSHIQSRLFVNKSALGDAGVLVPGRRWADQARGVSDLLRTQRRGRRRGRGDWQRIADEVAAHRGTAVVSMEFLGPSTPEVIAGVTASLPGAVEAVITVRDLNRSLVSMWQEAIQNGSTWGYRDYLDSAEKGRPGSWASSDPPAKPGRSFWRQQDVVRMARAWQAQVPLTLITVPPPGASHSLLWSRFCRVLDVPAEGWVDARRSNESLGAASAQLLRRVNQALPQDGAAAKHAKRVRKHQLAKKVLAGRKSHEAAIGLPVAPWVSAESARMVEELQRLDVSLLGDWAELQPVSVPGVDPEDATSEEVVEAAVAGLVGMVGRARRGRGRAV